VKPHPLALIIDEERATRSLLRFTLREENYRVVEAESGQRGLKLAAQCPPDVVILELTLPDLDGFRVIERLRARSRAPLLVLSERCSSADKVGALDRGANDYLTKPFDGAELLARLRVLQRSIPGVPDGPLLELGALRIDLPGRRVSVSGRNLSLSPTELTLLYFLARETGNVVSCDHLLRSVWGDGAEKKPHQLQVYIAALRKKLLPCREEFHISTEGRHGYRLAGSLVNKNGEFPNASEEVD